MAFAVVVLPIDDKPQVLIAADLSGAKGLYDSRSSTTVGPIYVIDVENNRLLDPGQDLRDCPYTFSHTRHWCGNDTCRDS